MKMKKLSVILIVICIFMSLSVNTFAYNYSVENSYSIEMPEDFSQVGEGKFIADDDSSFGITVKEKEDKKYCIENMSEEELLEEAKNEATAAAATFALIDKVGGTEVVSCKKVSHPDNKTACVTVYETYVEKDGEKISHLQKVYFFSCEKNDYTFVYTPQKDEDIDALDNTFNSIDIAEADAKSRTDTLKEMIPLSVIILLFLFGIFKFIRGRKK